MVKLASTISKHLKTVSATFLSCDQSTWLVTGLQQIHAAGYEARRCAVIHGSSSLPPFYPNPGPSRSGRYTAADHGTARPGSMIFARRTSGSGTISLFQVKSMLVDDQTCFVLRSASGTSHVLLRRPFAPCQLHRQEA